MKWLPNALTILRCALAFVVAWMIWKTQLGVIDIQFFNEPPEPALFSSMWAGWPFLLFVFAALLDYADGLAARLLDAVSEFGARLDPFADKLLVGAALIAICINYNWHPIFSAPTVIIIGRDVLVTILRSRVKGGVPVTRAAKWKTAIAMIAVGGLLLFLGGHAFGIPSDPAEWLGFASLGLLYLAAALSLFTGWQYVRAALRSGEAR